MGILIEGKDILIFEKYYEMYMTYKRAKYVKNYNAEVYNDLKSLYEKYIGKLTLAHWCSSCRAELLVQVYNFYEKNKVFNTIAEDIILNEVESVDVTKEEPVEVKKRGRKRKVI
jgi:hypothetical protein